MPFPRLATCIAAVCASGIATAAPGEAWAHAVEASAPWTPDPLAVLLLGATLALCVAGLARIWGRAGAGRGVALGRAAALGAGLLALGVALLSPLDGASAELVSAHMAQHMILMTVAAPLLVLGTPLPVMLAGLPAGWGRALARSWNRGRALPALWNRASRPLSAGLLQAAALWVWHAPAAYQGALTDRVVHDLEHLSFFATALLFWWSIAHVRGRPFGYASGVLSLFAAFMHSGLLAALMTFARSPWYPAYGLVPLEWGLTPLEDQQLAGLLMWVPGGLVYLGAGLLLLGRWLQRMEHRAGEDPERLDRRGYQADA